ncbi:hypothetical protein NPIL_616321 [Nephila pilipes]|uniref:Uncharacterized protein n=1 Tax=Nephila pilipes TaxID=299642 RepID=A0A8X6T504_NEPPI|nr:hypothetical protein NPIL_616321 [Nephila pilipes]
MGTCESDAVHSSDEALGYEFPIMTACCLICEVNRDEGVTSGLDLGFDGSRFSDWSQTLMDRLSRFVFKDRFVDGGLVNGETLACLDNALYN